jgi:hypothetical protein
MALECVLSGDLISRIPTMSRLVRLFLFLSLSWGAPGFAMLDKTPPAPDIEVIHAEFGLYYASPSGEWVLTPSATVPLEKGQHYGWSILLKTTKPRVKWREEFTLPSPPKSWGGEQMPVAMQTISPDHLTSVLEVDAIPVGGVIENMWEVEPGDPEGHYMIRVTIDGGSAQVFEFEVRK